jgi:glutaconate CoA-transferase subunit A
MRLNPSLATVKSPYADGEVLVAMPALDLDVALIHMHRGDQGGTGQCLGVDPYFDDLMCMAARKRFMSVEQIVDTEEFVKAGPPQSIRINRLMTDGVVETPHGAHFTECVPDYPRDEAFQRAYAASAKTEEAWFDFRVKYIDVTEAEYQAAVR